MDGRTDGQTDGWTMNMTCRDALSHLKYGFMCLVKQTFMKQYHLETNTPPECQNTSDVWTLSDLFVLFLLLFTKRHKYTIFLHNEKIWQPLWDNNISAVVTGSNFLFRRNYASLSVRPSVCPSVPYYFWMTNIAVFEGGETSSDQQ